MYERSLDYSLESKAINWRHARLTFIRWQQLMRGSYLVQRSGLVE